MNVTLTYDRGNKSFLGRTNCGVANYVHSSSDTTYYYFFYLCDYNVKLNLKSETRGEHRRTIGNLSAIAPARRSLGEVGSASADQKSLNDPFGKFLQGDNFDDGGSAACPFKFAGQYYDCESGLYYMRARMYDPAIGRFTSRDPVSGQFTEPLTLHKYLYCGNDPVNRIDPTGLWLPPTHHSMLHETFYDLPDEYKAAMYRGSDFVDTQYNDPLYSYMHEMRYEGQSVVQAQEEMWNFIFWNIKYYSLFRARGQYNDAYYYLGQAMHPIMDSTSPSHEGFQIWYGTEGKENEARALNHGRRELWPSTANFREAMERMNMIMDEVEIWLD